MKLAMIVAVALVMSVASFAAPTSCASPTPLSTFTPPPDPDEGCLVVNNTFVSFDVPQASAGQFTLTDPTTIVGFTLTANTVSTPTPTQIFVRESPTDQGSIQFTSPGPATGKSADPATNFCSSSSGSQGWCIQGADQSLVSSITYVGNFTTAVSNIGLTGTVVSHSSGGGGATAVVFREYCPDTDTFTQGCTGYGVLQGGSINGNFNTLPFLATASLAPTTQIAFRDTVFLDTNNGSGSFAAVLGFDMITTPEPATFLLFGAGLMGLGLARFRGKRKRA